MIFQENMLCKTKYKGSYSQGTMPKALLINFSNLENEANLTG